MTQEEKQLLIKDLCARLPYANKAECGTDYDFQNDITDTVKLLSLDIDSELCRVQAGNYVFNEAFYNIKLYLRPMSSMTEEEKLKYHNLSYEEEREEYEFGELVTRVYYHDTLESIDWLNAHYFDYRGLIEKGLALEAPEGMYNTKNE